MARWRRWPGIIFFMFVCIYFKFPVFQSASLLKINILKTVNRNISKMSLPMKRKSEATSSPSQPKKPFWALGLTKSLTDPKYIVESDDKVTIIKDMYPKAKFHYLVMPKEEISDPKACTTEHLPLLKHMEVVARKYVRENHPEVQFNFGYHAQISMHHLHLHVISDDMDSPCVKTKKHWNSFTTEYFIKSSEFRKSLEENGKVLLPSNDKCKEYLETPLKCHKCDFIPKHMPHLKKHIIIHLKEEKCFVRE